MLSVKMPLFIVLSFYLLQPSAQQDRYRIVEDESIVAIITHKAGIASAFAHNHLITAHSMDVNLTYSDDDASPMRVNVTIPVDSLKADDPAMKEKWGARIAELEIEDNLGAPSEKDRRKIAGEMFSRKQLAAADYDSITARLVESIPGEIDFECVGSSSISTLELTIRGQTNTVEFPTCTTVATDTLSIEALGFSTFTEFGIKPFSGVLGTVKNKNEFDIYINIKAAKE